MNRLLTALFLTGMLLVSQGRTEDIAHETGIGGPIGAELKFHYDPGGYTHGKVNGENLGPELRRLFVILVTRFEVSSFQHDD